MMSPPRAALQIYECARARRKAGPSNGALYSGWPEALRRPGWIKKNRARATTPALSWDAAADGSKNRSARLEGAAADAAGAGTPFPGAAAFPRVCFGARQGGALAAGVTSVQARAHRGGRGVGSQGLLPFAPGRPDMQLARSPTRGTIYFLRLPG